jgi:hypothetical protein
MNDKLTTPMYLRYGGAKKSTFDMNQEELEEAAQSILRRARETAFSRGLPIYFSKDKKLMAEYPNGHIEVVKND